MTPLRRLVWVAFVVVVSLHPVDRGGSGRRVHAQSVDRPSLVGAWTVNTDLSDAPQDPSFDGREARGRGRRGARGGGGFGRGVVTPDPETDARMRGAIRDLMNPPAHLTIVQAGTLIIITGADGRTTRLSPDGKKVTDESTKIERRTVWTDGHLVSEITGLGRGRLTETYSPDPEHHQLRLSVQMERRPDAVRVYDADPR
jgi:hypothetical protein